MERLIKSLLKTYTSEGTEDLPFAEIDELTMRRCFKDAAIDIDFISVRMPVSKFCGEPTIGSLLSNFHGKFYRSPCISTIRSSREKKVAVIGDFGTLSFRLAIPFIAAKEIQEQDSNEEFEKEIAVSDNAAFEENGTFALVRGNKMLIVEKLNQIPSRGEALPWRDMKDLLISNFENFDVVLFKYGQKMDLNDFINMFHTVAEKAEIDIALGVEMSVEGSVILAKGEGFVIGKEFYSQLLSTSFGNILISDERKTQKILPFSNRICVYNTVQHERKHLSSKISFYESPDLNKSKGEETHDFVDLRDIAYKAISPTFESWRNAIPHAYDTSKIRVESYFNLNSLLKYKMMDCIGSSIKENRKESKIQLKEVLFSAAGEMFEFVLRKCHLSAVSTDLVLRYLRTVAETISYAFTVSVPEEKKFTALYCSFGLFRLTSMCFFGNVKMSQIQLKKMRGFGLQYEDFDENMEIENLKLLNVQEVMKPLAPFQNSRNYILVKGIYFLEYLTEMSRRKLKLHEKDEKTIIECLQESLKHLNEENSIPGGAELLSFEEFVQKALLKHRKSFLTSCFLKTIKMLLNTQIDYLMALITKMDNFQLQLKSGASHYIFHSQKSYDLLYFFKKFLIGYNLDKLKAVLEAYADEMLMEETQEYILAEKVFAIYKEAVKIGRKWLKEELLGTLKVDVLARLLISNVVTIDLNHSENVELPEFIPIILLFSSSQSIAKYLAIGLCFVKYNGRLISKFLKSRRDEVTKSIRFRFKVSQLLYCTGLFENGRYNDENEQRELEWQIPIPQRNDFTCLIQEEDRLPILQSRNDLKRKCCNIFENFTMENLERTLSHIKEVNEMKRHTMVENSHSLTKVPETNDKRLVNNFNNQSESSKGSSSNLTTDEKLIEWEKARNQKEKEANQGKDSDIKDLNSQSVYQSDSDKEEFRFFNFNHKRDRQPMTSDDESEQEVKISKLQTNLDHPIETSTILTRQNNFQETADVQEPLVVNNEQLLDLNHQTESNTILAGESNSQETACVKDSIVINNQQLTDKAIELQINVNHQNESSTILTEQAIFQENAGDKNMAKITNQQLLEEAIDKSAVLKEKRNQLLDLFTFELIQETPENQIATVLSNLFETWQELTCKLVAKKLKAITK